MSDSRRRARRWELGALAAWLVVNARDRRGRPAALYAANHGYHGIVRRLREAGATWTPAPTATKSAP